MLREAFNEQYLSCEYQLGARDVEEIFAAFAEAMRELPPDVEAGWLDAQGDLRLAPDIARKLRTARRVRQLLQELRQRQPWPQNRQSPCPAALHRKWREE